MRWVHPMAGTPVAMGFGTFFFGGFAIAVSSAIAEDMKSLGGCGLARRAAHGLCPSEIRRHGALLLCMALILIHHCAPMAGKLNAEYGEDVHSGHKAFLRRDSVANFLALSPNRIRQGSPLQTPQDNGY